MKNSIGPRVDPWGTIVIFSNPRTSTEQTMILISNVYRHFIYDYNTLFRYSMINNSLNERERDLLSWTHQTNPLNWRLFSSIWKFTCSNLTN